jgi:hypothetical protein
MVRRFFLEPDRVKNWELWISATVVILTVFFMYAYFNRWFSFAATVGPFRIIHYVAFAGTLYIAFGVILFSIYKTRKPKRYKTLLRLHTFGNLVAFLLVSLHFAGQLGRPADFYPQFGTGVALYIGMVSLVGTGLILKFLTSRSLRPQTNRFIHTALAFAFYIIIVVHIFHGLNII